MREKLRDRVFTVSVPQLSLHIPRDSIPVHLGGTLRIDHSTWLLYCSKSMTNREEDELLSQTAVPPLASADDDDVAIVVVGGEDDQLIATAVTLQSTATASTNANSSKNDDETNTNALSVNGSSDLAAAAVIVVAQNGTNNISSISSSDAATTTTEITSTPETNGIITDQWMSSENPPSSASSGFSDDDSLTGGGANESGGGDPKTMEQVVDMVRKMGRKGLLKEYAEIRARQPDGSFDNAKLRSNLTKNRYTDVLCYDHSRVVLSHEGDDDDPTNDYINANFVDGYKQKNAYISTQGENFFHSILR